MSSMPHQVILGSPEHGVVRLASNIATALAQGHPSLSVIRAATVDELFSIVASGRVTGPAHLHVTDRLLGSNSIRAAERFEQLASSIPLSVTLHDLPQPSDGEGFTRRVEGYRRIIAASRAVACNSWHEVRLIDEHLRVDTAGVTVIPLPVAVRERADRSAHLRREIAVLGFIYPGKGHAEVIRAVAAMPAFERPRVAALGRPSPGHEADTDDLRRAADRGGVEFEITGFLDDAEQLARAHAAAVPVVALQHVSASGSTATWIEAGRRPLMPASRYGREVAELRPGTVTLYDAPSLQEALLDALADPASTWIAPGVDTRPHPGDTAGAYRDWWRGIRW